MFKKKNNLFVFCLTISGKNTYNGSAMKAVGGLYIKYTTPESRILFLATHTFYRSALIIKGTNPKYLFYQL